MAIQALLFAWLYPRIFDRRREAWLRSALFGATFCVLAWSFTSPLVSLAPECAGIFPYGR